MIVACPGLRKRREAGATPRRRRYAAALTGLAVATVGPAVADAQTYGELFDSEIPLQTVSGRNQGVLDRIKPELTPVGLPLGGFRLYPSLLGGIGFSDNVIGAETAERTDGYARVSPQAEIRSQWARHSLNAIVNYDGLRYFRTQQKDQDGFFARVDGRIDILERSSVEGGASFRRTYEDQQEASFPAGGGGAVSVEQTMVLLRGTHVTNRLRWTGNADYNGFTYGDTVSTNGTRLDLSFRDRNVYRASARAEYMLGQDNSVFAQFSYRRTDYSTSDARNDRTGNEWRAMAGVITDTTSLVRVTGAIGYFRRAFSNDILFRPIGGLVADVRAEYYITPLTTISAIATRRVEEAAVLSSSGFVSSRYGVRVDHELRRNLMPYLSVDRQRSNFKGIDRNDGSWNFGGGANYWINRSFTLNASTTYVTRVSRGVDRGPEIDEFRGLLTLRFNP